MSTSISPFAFIIALEVSREVSSIRFMQSGESPAEAIASRIIFARAMLERMASFPPRSTAALPDFRHKTAASTVTLGRASKIMPITPRGTFFFRISKPLGRTVPYSVLPTGSSSAITAEIASAMPLILFSSSIRRSSIESLMLPLAFSRSILFCSIMYALFSTSAFAIASRARFLSAVDATASCLCATLAPSQILVSIKTPPFWEEIRFRRKSRQKGRTEARAFRRL